MAKKKILAILSILALVGALAGCGSSSNTQKQKAASSGKAQTIVVATRGTSKPFSYADDSGKLTGYDVEVLREVEKRDPSLHFEFQSMPVDAGFIAMKNKKVDLIANQMSYRPSRAKNHLYTHEAYGYTVRRLVVKKGRTDIHSLEDLKGKKLGTTSNSTLKILADKFNQTADPKIELVFSEKGSAEILNLLATDRIDAAGDYEYNVKWAVKDRNLPIESVGKPLEGFPTFYVLRKDPKLQPVADKIDAQIKAMRADGTLKKLSEKFLLGDYTVKPDFLLSFLPPDWKD